ELLGPGDRAGLPRLAAVCGTNECSACAAGPDDVGVDDAQSVQASVGVRLLRMPLGEGGRNNYQGNDEYSFHVLKSLPKVTFGNASVFHDELNSFQFGDVSERISCNSHDVGEFSRLNCADSVGPA